MRRVSLDDDGTSDTAPPPFACGSWLTARAVPSPLPADRWPLVIELDAVAVPAWILGPDARVRATNALARDRCPPPHDGAEPSLGDVLRALGFVPPATLPDRIAHALRGDACLLSLDPHHANGPSLALRPVLLRGSPVGACATLLEAPRARSVHGGERLRRLLESAGIAVFSCLPGASEIT